MISSSFCFFAVHDFFFNILLFEMVTGVRNKDTIFKISRLVSAHPKHENSVCGMRKKRSVFFARGMMMTG